METFIICHQDLPCYRVPADATIVWLNATLPQHHKSMKIVSGYDVMPDGAALHQPLSGALGPMVILNIIKSMNLQQGNITLWQYRKFVTREKFGMPSKNYGCTHDVSIKEAASAHIVPVPEENQEYIASVPMSIGNLSKQYMMYHHISDLLKYTALAVDMGTLSEDESFLFLNCAHLIIGGIELGTYPVAWWRNAFETVQKVSLAFIENHQPFNGKDPYQKRAVAFCQERLGSYLLLKELSRVHNNNLPLSLFGTVHTVTEEGIYQRGI